MYNSLRGTITELGSDHCAIDVGGVEYLVSISTASLGKLSLRAEARILVYLHHKEDQLKLFGFADQEERDIFIKLLKVSGVGPSLALKVLSGIPGRVLKEAIEAGDIARLSGVPGLGKKTAQKIVLALQGTLVAGDVEHKGPDAELAAALVEMGFDRSAAIKAIREIKDKHAGEKPLGEESLLREAIVALSSGGAR